MEAVLEQVTIVEMLTAFIAVTALVATAVSIYFQRKHNHNSVRPVFDLQCQGTVDKIAVTLRNAGTGPMTITSMIVLFDGEKKRSIADCFSEGHISHIKQFYRFEYERMQKGERSIIPGEEIALISLCFKEEEAERDRLLNFAVDHSRAPQMAVGFLAGIDTLRKIEIIVAYEDIYKNEFGARVDLSERFDSNPYLLNRHFKRCNDERKKIVLIGAEQLRSGG